MVSVSVEQLVAQIHASATRIVLAATGGGSRAIADLLAVPGASRTLLEATVPYADKALVAWLGGQPDQFCSSQTARAMAMAALWKAVEYGDPADPLAGVACTAALASDRPKRGPHRAHLAVQSAGRTVAWSLELQKGPRSRGDEERLVGRLLLNAVAAACGIEARLDPGFREGERLEQSETAAPRAWQDLLLGRIESLRLRGDATPCIFPGAFHPLHAGHRRMIDIAQNVLGMSVAVEISILNVDKPPLDYIEIERRVRQFTAQQAIWLTRAATFDEKSRLFPGATFIVGADTLQRIGDPRYYGNDTAASLAAIARIAQRGCHFLVFGRDVKDGFLCLENLPLPEPLKALCHPIPSAVFREDISSTAIRKSQDE